MPVRAVPEIGPAAADRGLTLRLGGFGMNRKSKVWIGFDLGATKMLAVVYSGDGKMLAQRRRRNKDIGRVSAGIKRIEQTIRETLEAADVKPSQVGGIGIGCPGPVDMERGVLLHAPNLGWTQAPLQREFSRRFGCPAVAVNDVDAGTFGEYTAGAARGARCVVGVFPGTGIGGGCVYEGRIVRGASHSCFEIGHCRVLPDGPLCGCGRRGCLESVASRLAISAAVAAAAYRGEAPHVLEAAGTDLSNIRSAVLARAIANGDEAVREIVENAARWLGIGIGGVVNLLAPDIVVLGGGLVEAMPTLYRKTVLEAARGAAMPAFRRVFRVVVARLGDDAVALGAAAWARAVIEEQRPRPDRRKS